MALAGDRFSSFPIGKGFLLVLCFAFAPPWFEYHGTDLGVQSWSDSTADDFHKLCLQVRTACFITSAIFFKACAIAHMREPDRIEVGP